MFAIPSRLYLPLRHFYDNMKIRVICQTLQENTESGNKLSRFSIFFFYVYNFCRVSCILRAATSNVLGLSYLFMLSTASLLSLGIAIKLNGIDNNDACDCESNETRIVLAL